MHPIPKIGALALSLSVAFSCHANGIPGKHDNDARITEAQARAAALAKVPGGRVKSNELEKENGRLIWTFDIARTSIKGVTEVHVDAKTGRVISIKRETPAQEAKEAEAEKDTPK